MITVIGERLNSTRRAVAQAIAQRDADFVRREAQAQTDAGAHYLDVNAAAGLTTEIEDLQWMIKTIQEVVSTPLCIDSPDAKAIAAGLEVATGEVMVNSITAEQERAHDILPMVRERKARVVGLTISEAGMPNTATERRDLALRILELGAEYDVTPDRVYIDALVRPIGTESGQGREFLRGLRAIRDASEQVHLVCGLSNISFGLPRRHLLNRIFLAMAMTEGLDAAIVDPRDQRLMATIYAGCALLGTDDFCMDYLSAHREGRLGEE